MTTPSEIWNLSAVCRCCHTDGIFRNLSELYVYENENEVYCTMLMDTFNVEISKPLMNASYTICDDCVVRLRDATNFKKQVTICEEKFMEYCKNELALIENDEDIKIEIEVDARDGLTLTEKEDVKIEIDTDTRDVDDTGFGADELSVDVKSEVGVNENVNKIKGDNTVKAIVKKKKGVRKKHTTAKEEFQSIYDFSLEMVVKTDSGTIYSCKTCGGSYKEKKMITRHITSNHLLGKPYICDICSKIFTNKGEITRHKLRHERPWECPYCPRTFSSTYTLNYHINKHTTSNIYKCDLCPKEFLYKSSLNNHLKIHNGTRKKCICYICGNPFNDSTNMKIHIRTVHEKLRPYICDYCEKSYPAKKDLILHIKKHMNYKPFKCNKCRKRFYSIFYKNNHSCHDNIYKCKICSKIYKDRSTFTKHVKRTHSGDRPYKCSVCNKDFTCKYSRDRHELSHTGLKPHTCVQCDMKFAQKSILNRHIMRMHNITQVDKINRIQCLKCMKVVSDLKQHNLNCHNSNSNIMCEFCNKCYSTKNTLNRHKRVMHNDMFKCDYCNKKYKQKNNLTEHQMKMHNIILKVEDNDT